MGRRLNNDFTCHKCKVEPNELWSYGPYGLDRYKLKHDGEYCQDCFNIINKQYDNKPDNMVLYSNIDELQEISK